MQKNQILLAGATGYLGRFITQELIDRDFESRIIVRNKEKVKLQVPNLEVIEAQVTKPNTLEDICKGVDVVISTVGITRQKDGLTYMDVDYQANKNLLDEAKRSGVEKFIYVSAFNGEKLTHLKIGEAKEKFVVELKKSGLDYCILRPNGFFSDMTDFLKMAKKGKAELFGDGNFKMNPIHGADLAKVCVNAINANEKTIDVGGPEIFTHNEIVELAFSSLNKQVKVSYMS